MWRHKFRENDSLFHTILSCTLNESMVATKERTMTLKDMEFTLKSNGVDDEDVKTVISHYKKSHATFSELDEMLIGMGYEKIFTDELFGWLDDEEDEYESSFSYSEKRHQKPQWVD